MNSIFKERLRTLRMQKDRTQLEIAQHLGVSRSTYGEYERGNIVPPAEKINKLAEYFAVSSDYLMGNTNDARRDFISYQATDISASMENLLEHLEHDKVVVLEGRELDEETRKLLHSSILNNYNLIKTLAKKGV